VRTRTIAINASNRRENTPDTSDQRDCPPINETGHSRTSVTELIERIGAFIDHWNGHAQPARQATGGPVGHPSKLRAAGSCKAAGQRRPENNAMTSCGRPPEPAQFSRLLGLL
jgi:hypothetical protein